MAKRAYYVIELDTTKLRECTIHNSWGATMEKHVDGIIMPTMLRFWYA